LITEYTYNYMYIVTNKYVMYVYIIYWVEKFDEESLKCIHLKLLDIILILFFIYLKNLMIFVMRAISGFIL